MKAILDIDELVFSPPDLGGVLYLPGLPGGSNKIYDRSPYGSAGTITGATWKRLPSGLWYLHHDGTDDRIDIDGARSDLATTTAGTWQVWVNPDDNSKAMSFIAFGDTDANSYIMLWELNGSDGKVRGQVKIADVNQWILQSDDALLSNGVWSNLALRHDGTSPVLYHNGVAIAQTFVVSTDKTKWFNDIAGLDNGYLGRLSKNSGDYNYVDGKIALPHIHSVDKGADNIKDTFNRERHLFGVW